MNPHRARYRRRRAAWPALAVLALMAASPRPAVALEPITAEAAVAPLAGLKQYATIRAFRLGGRYDLAQPPSAFESGARNGGVSLEYLGAPPLKIGYIAVGTPERNAKGEITNAVVVASYGSGDATTMYAFWYEGQPSTSLAQGPVVGPGRPIDTQKFYVVFVDGLGLWGLAKPSAGLGTRFPAYSYYDMAQVIWRLLRDQLHVARVRLATGISLGGTQSYLLAAMHPEFVDAILPIDSATVSDPGDPAAYWTLALAKAAIEADPVWMATNGAYYDRPKSEHPNQGVMFSWSLLGLTAVDPRYRAQQPWASVQREVFAWAPHGEEGLNLLPRAQDYDAVDLHHRARAGMSFSMADDLQRIRARTLILQVENDRWVSLAAARATAARIPGAMLLSFPHPLAHFASFAAPNVFKDVVRAFVEDQFLPQTVAMPER